MAVRSILIAGAALLLGAGPAAAGSFAEKDLTDRTATFPRFLVVSEWLGRGGGNHLVGGRLISSVRPQPWAMVSIEVPVYASKLRDLPWEGGPGDIFGEALFQVWRRPTGLARAVAVMLNFYVPSGRPEKGLGSDQWLFELGGTAKLAPTSWMRLYPHLGYLHSFNATREGSAAAPGFVLPGTGEVVSLVARALRVLVADVQVSFALPHRAWVSVIPSVIHDFESNRGLGFLTTNLTKELSPHLSYLLKLSTQIWGSRALDLQITTGIAYVY